MTNRLRSYFALMKRTSELRGVQRHNWGIEGRPESSAEHTASVAIFCLILYQPLTEEFGKLDLELMLGMAVSHDFPEVDAGDVSVWKGRARAEQADKDRLAAVNLFGLLPQVSGARLMAFWEEFETGDSREAQIVRGLDALDPVFQRVMTGQGWKNVGEKGKTAEDLDVMKLPKIEFSKTLMAIYKVLREKAVAEDMFAIG